jgi:membrane-associated protein
MIRKDWLFQVYHKVFKSIKLAFEMNDKTIIFKNVASVLEYEKFMDVGGLVAQAVSLTGSFNLWLVLAIFLITLFAEFGISIPYLLESIWLLVGYGLSTHAISPTSIIIFCTIGLCGREIGASSLYRISGFGVTPAMKIYDKIIALSPRFQNSRNPVIKKVVLPLARFINRFFLSRSKFEEEIEDRERALFKKIACRSPFSVALGRFTWLKLPITISMGMARQLFVLIMGVALFSLAWDSIYILIGLFGASSKVSSTMMLICTIGGFITVQVSIFFIRRWIKSRRLTYARS